MKRRPFLTRLLSALSRWPWQVTIASLAFGAVLIFSLTVNPQVSSPDLRQTAYVLASIAAVLALATSVAFGFLVFFLNQTNARKHDLYFRFKNTLFELDKFLKEYPPSVKLVHLTSALSWELKSLRMSDFPLMDWDMQVNPIVKVVNEEDSHESIDPNLSNKILRYLVYLEDLISEIGTACIRQVVAGVHIGTVLKALSTLGLLLVCLVISYLITASAIAHVLAALPAFFAVLGALILLEIGWYLHREGGEMLDFVEGEEESALGSNQR